MIEDLLSLSSALFAVGVACILVAWLALSLLARLLERDGHPLLHPLKTLRSFVFPLGVVLYTVIYIAEIPHSARAVRILETFFWIGLVWCGVGAIKVFLLKRISKGEWQGRVPGLLVDLSRFAVGIIGVLVVIADVWEQDLGQLLATLGIGSIVLGLALQDTLGNLFAGIALFFERPFTVGQWVQIGDVVGRVTEMNWRAVRLITRDEDIVVVPNSNVGKEKIINLSSGEAADLGRCDKRNREKFAIGFSYSDPPNKVKRMLIGLMQSTPGILSEPQCSVLVTGYGNFSVDYSARFYTEDVAQVPIILDRFISRIWYASRRNGLTIPFPTHTILKTEMPAAPARAAEEVRRQTAAALSKVGCFAPLAPAELQELAQAAVILEFAAGEAMVRQGEGNSALYVIERGSARVVHHGAAGAVHDVTTLGSGDFFGEMSLLTGEPCTADVLAAEDLEAVVVDKAMLEQLILRRPDLAEQIGAIVAVRRRDLAASEQSGGSAPGPAADRAAVEPSALVARIRRFFGL